ERRTRRSTFELDIHAQCVGDVFGNESVAEILVHALGGQRAQVANDAPARTLAAVAPHRPDVVVADRRRVVEPDLGARTNFLGGKEDETLVHFAKSGVRLARVIDVSAGAVAGVDVRLGAEADAVGGKSAASLPEQVGIDDAAGDDENLLAGAEAPRREQTLSISRRGDGDVRV